MDFKEIIKEFKNSKLLKEGDKYKTLSIHDPDYMSPEAMKASEEEEKYTPAGVIDAFMKAYWKELESGNNYTRRNILKEFWIYVEDLVTRKVKYETVIKELEDEASDEEEHRTQWADPEDHEQPPGEVKPYRENY